MNGFFCHKGPSIYDIRFLGGGVCLQKSEIIGYRGVGGSAKIGYPIYQLKKQQFRQAKS